MRVLVLTNLYPPHHYGGYELACQWVVQRWRDQGHAVEVVTGDHRVPGVPDEPEPGVTRGLRFYWADHDLVTPPPWRRFAWERDNHRRWGSVLDAFAPDVVSVWNHGAMSYALLAEVVDRDLPLVLVVADDWLRWGPDFDHWTAMFEHRGRLGRVAGAAVRAVTGVRTRVPDLGSRAVALFASRWLADRAATSSRFRFRHQAVVPWGIDPVVFPVTDDGDDHGNDDVDDDAAFGWRLALVGRVDERKGTFTAVRALAELPEASLELVGPATPEARSRVEGLARSLGVADRVRLAAVAPAAVRARYLAADVALFPSEWAEPFGLVGLEAMACARPLVATGTGGSGEYLQHEVNALVVPPGDSTALAAAVRRLAADPALRRRLVAGGRRTASAFTAVAMADELEAWHAAAAARFAAREPTRARIVPDVRSDPPMLRTSTATTQRGPRGTAAVSPCPACGGLGSTPAWRVPGGLTEGGVDPESFRPSADRYGRSLGTVVRCAACGHGYLGERLDARAVQHAYEDAADPVSLREEPGQLATADRALALIERWRPPGRLVDLGCWTGSFVEAASRRGWRASGVEPSAWAVARAAERGLDVRRTTIAAAGLDDGSVDAAVLCDVLEHLEDPGAALDRVHRALARTGVLYLTVPDAGSALARALGRRWWSVLPMHLQYFTRASMTRLLDDHGFEVLHLSTHAKAFSLRYYAERAIGLLPVGRAAATRLLDRLPGGAGLVAPDLRDRMQVVAARVDRVHHPAAR